MLIRTTNSSPNPQTWPPHFPSAAWLCLLSEVPRCLRNEYHLRLTVIRFKWSTESYSVSKGFYTNHIRTQQNFGNSEKRVQNINIKKKKKIQGAHCFFSTFILTCKKYLKTPKSVEDFILYCLLSLSHWRLSGELSFAASISGCSTACFQPEDTPCWSFSPGNYPLIWISAM